VFQGVKVTFWATAETQTTQVVEEVEVISQLVQSTKLISVADVSFQEVVNIDS